MHVELHGAVYRVTVGITVRYGGADVRDGDFQEGRCPAGGAGGGANVPTFCRSSSRSRIAVASFIY